jgi:hypothetical protein
MDPKMEGKIGGREKGPGLKRRRGKSEAQRLTLARIEASRLVVGTVREYGIDQSSSRCVGKATVAKKE